MKNDIDSIISLMKSFTPSSDKEEMGEQDAAPAAAGGGGGGKAAYPTVTKWESGVTRGTANQIGVTKWSDIVGSTLKRGKSNPLK